MRLRKKKDTEETKFEKYEKIRRRNHFLKNCLIIYVITCIFSFMLFYKSIVEFINPLNVILSLSTFSLVIQLVIVPIVYLFKHFTPTFSKMYATVRPKQKVFASFDIVPVSKKERKKQKTEEDKFILDIQELKKEYGE